MGDVVILPVITRLDQPVERILDMAVKADLKGVVIVGYDANGNEFFASSYASGGDALWHLQRASLKLLSV